MEKSGTGPGEAIGKLRRNNGGSPAACVRIAPQPARQEGFPMAAAPAFYRNGGA